MLKIVDDGKGNAFIFERNRAVYTDLHWYWMDASYNGHCGGVLLNMTEIGMFYSIAVDIDKELLYVGRKQSVSVFKLIYELSVFAGGHNHFITNFLQYM